MRKKLYIPGPTEVLPEVLAKMATPPIGHRSKETSALVARMTEKLCRLLATQAPVYVINCAATAVMEGAIRNCARKRVLCLTCGAFSERWFKICGANNRPADQLAVPWGKAHEPAALHEALKTGKYDCVTVVHNETSTGVMNPIEALAAVVRQYPDVLLCVDAVSSMAGVPILMDEWGIDVLLAGVQKAFALPPGVTVAAVSERAHERAATIGDRGFYVDFVQLRQEFEERQQTPATPSTSHYFALDYQLDRLFAEGLEARWARHREMAAYVRGWAAERFELFAPEGARSVTLTVIKNNRGADLPALIAHVGERGFAIASGYGKLKADTFRISHMGDQNLADLRAITAAADEFLGG